MKKSDIKILLVLAGVLAVALSIFLYARPKKEEIVENEVVEEFVQVLDDGTKLNTSSKLQEEKTINGLKIGNIQLTEKNGQLVLLADVTNPTEKDSEIFLIDIILYDKTGKEIATVPGIVSPIKAGGKTQLNAGITEKYANAYDFKVVKK